MKKPPAGNPPPNAKETSASQTGDKKIAGIDVSKEKLDVCIYGESTAKQFNNTEKGIKELVEFFKKKNVGVIGIEATSVYHMDVRDSIVDTEIMKVAVFQPALVRHYIRSQKRIAKTDNIDASMIAEYTNNQIGNKKIIFCTEKNLVDDEMRAKLVRIDQLKEDVCREKSRLESCRDESIKIHLEKSIKRLNQEIKKLDKLMISNLKLSEEQKIKYNILTGYESIGPVTAIVLMAYLPELGLVNRRQIAALAGCAPYSNDSGKRQGKRSIFGGRGRVRMALYMAALSAIQHHEVIKDMHEKYIRKGKAKKVSIMACARHLIAYINSDLPKRLASAGKLDSKESPDDLATAASDSLAEPKI